jgi:spermidine synthase
MAILFSNRRKWSIFSGSSTKTNDSALSYVKVYSLFSIITMVFVAGTVTMALEFAASRLIVPVFGSSIYTWGSLIGVILSGLSLGYYAGGRLADRKDAGFIKFCSIIFSAGLYIIFIPSFIAPTAIEISTHIASPITLSTILDNSSNHNDYGRYACLLATFLLLLTPTFLLGIVSPYAVKLTTKSLSRLGNMAGNLYSLSTIGSIVGTFLTVFVLIPIFELNYIIYGLGLSLIISSSFSYLFTKDIKITISLIPKVLATCAIALVFLSNTFLSSNSIPYYTGTLVYQKETPYAHLDVVDTLDNRERNLLLDGRIHSTMNKTNSDALTYYTSFFPTGLLFNTNAENILFAGGGGFIGPKAFLSAFPKMNVDVVELDPVVIDAAKRYFNIHDNNPRLKIYNYDARDFLSKTHDGKYDIIFLDAFSKNNVPFHLMTLQYYELLYKKLGSNGVVVSNQIGSLEGGPTSDLFRAVYKTMSQVFPHVYVFPTLYDEPNKVQNIILVATKSDLLRTKADIKNTEQSYQNQINDIPSYAKGIDYTDYMYDTTRIKTEDVPLFSDQLAPVEKLLDPITNSAYYTGKETSTNQKVNPDSIQAVLITYALPLIVCVIWVLYMQNIWRMRDNENPILKGL